jgi:hypothetical protein
MSDKVKANLEASGESQHASAIHDRQQSLLKRYADRVGDDRAWMLGMGGELVQLVALNLSLAKDEPDAKLHRAQTTQWLADRVKEQFGDTVSPDEWIAVYEAHAKAKSLTTSADSSRISTRFLRVARKWVVRAIVPAETGYREEWAILPGHAEAFKTLFETQAKAPMSRDALKTHMRDTTFEIEQTRITGLTDPAEQAKAQKRLDKAIDKAIGNDTATSQQTRELPTFAEWTARDATTVAAAIIAADNLPAAKALVAMLGPYIVAAAESPAPTPSVVPITAEAQIRKVA